jgi:hypothetical protein
MASLRPLRLLCAALLAIVGLSGCLAGGEEADRPAAQTRPHVRTFPAHVAPGTSVRITYPTPYALGDRPPAARTAKLRVGPPSVQSYDNYHVVFRGPGGSDCRGRLHFAVGYPVPHTQRRSASALVRPTRRGTPSPRGLWCQGRFTGHVEFRQPDRDPAIPFERLGRFTFEVASEGRRSASR